MKNSDKSLGRKEFKEFLDLRSAEGIRSTDNTTPIWLSAVVQESSVVREKNPINPHNIDVDRVAGLGNNKYDR
jgi:hypothetical protein